MSKKNFVFLIIIFIVVFGFLIFHFRKTEKVGAQAGANFLKTIGGTKNETGRSIIQTTDGGYIVTSETNSWSAGGYYDVLLLKLDSTGNLSWIKSIGGTGSEFGWSIIQTTDGGYIVTGETDSWGVDGHDVLLLKLDSAGNLSWAKAIGEKKDERGRSIIQTTDGGYIVTGSTDSWGAANANILFLKFDLNNNLQWTRVIGKGGVELGYSIIQTTDGGYIVTGSTDSWGAGGYDFLLLKLDSTGNLSWIKAIGGTGNDFGYSIIQTTDGGYIVTGETYSWGAGSRDVLLLKLDSAGNLSWAKAIGGNSFDFGNSVIQTAGGGYIVTGSTYSWGLGLGDILLLKTDNNGNISACSPITSVSPTVTISTPTVSLPPPPPPSVDSPIPNIISPFPTVTTPTSTITNICPAAFPSIPIVSTSIATNITLTTATLNGNILATGGATVDERGFEWGTVSGSYPNSWTESGTFGTGTFNHTITGLNPNTTYYFRGKAYNSAGWGYGEEMSFTTSPSPTTNVSLWAWSENIGWISFNCNNTNYCSTVDYGVNIDPSTGYFSGYAWSDNIGWITFNETDLSGCPVSPCRAWVNLSCPGGQCPVYGWAKVVAHNGDWPGGWIRLRDTNYGVWIDPSLTPAEFKGWAWSDLNIGWISFNCLNQGVCGTSDYKVITTLSFNSPPYVESIDLDGTPVYCNIMPGRGRVGLKWTYQDNEGDNQTEYHLQVATDSGFGNLVVDATSSQTVSSGGIGTAAVWTVPNPTPETNDFDIGYGGSYYWRVKVKAATGSQDWSDWGAGPNFTTPSHAYPWPDFAPRPSKPSIGEIVTFIQDGSDLNNTEALCYSGGVGLCQNKGVVSYEWDFDFNINPGTDSTYKGNATTTYTSIVNYNVILTITDDVGFCSKSKTLNLSLPLPKWKEIPPG